MTTRRVSRVLLPGALYLLALVVGWALRPSAPTVSEAPPPPSPTAEAAYHAPGGTPAPDFALRTLSGDTFRLSDQRGRVVVLNFWATWCPPCRVEIPDFIALQDAFGTDDVVFVGVSLDEGGRERVARFADQMGINYPIAIDDGSADAAYGPISSLPATFLIDRAGEVRSYVPGMATREMLEPVLAALVAEPAE